MFQKNKAQHQGGEAFGSVWRKACIGRATLRLDELSTLLVEIEAVITCQLLTFVYDDEGISLALTPAHMIYRCRINMTPNSIHHEIMSTHQSLTRRVRHHRQLLEQFTNCWKRDYLLNLQDYSHTLRQQWQDPHIKVGIVILLYNEGTKAFWRHAIVERLIECSYKGNVKLLQCSILFPLRLLLKICVCLRVQHMNSINRRHHLMTCWLPFKIWWLPLDPDARWQLKVKLYIKSGPVVIKMLLTEASNPGECRNFIAIFCTYRPYVITPRACARGKVISLCGFVCRRCRRHPKIAGLGDLGTFETHKLVK